MTLDPLGLAVAFAAGVLSFLSPCVLPLVPSYISYLSGMSAEELAGAAPGARRRGHTVLVHGLLFTAGFSLVFVALGASATFLGSLLSWASVWLERVGGVLLVLFGLLLLGALRLPGAAREWRFQLADRPLGYLGSVLVGVIFAAGWTPCIGPVLGGILTLAATRQSVAEGTSLLAVYSVGLAIPFLLAAALMDRFLGGMKRLRPLLPWIHRISGALLITVGLLLLTGTFSWLSGLLANLTPGFIRERI
ncbi:MAG: cytochrome c biogenesis CcdA family protein [Longimicrobiaceae bacterium]